MICPICLQAPDDIYRVASLAHCPHVFCDSCLLPWLLRNPTCPVCRCPSVALLLHRGPDGRELHGPRKIDGSIPLMSHSIESLRHAPWISISGFRPAAVPQPTDPFTVAPQGHHIVDPPMDSLEDLALPANRHIESHDDDEDLNGAADDTSQNNTDPDRDQQGEGEGQNHSHGTMDLEDDQGNPENEARHRHSSRRA